MAGRYLITGVQIGMLLAINSKKERAKILKEIQEKQFIGNSNKSVKDDAKSLSIKI